MLIAIFVAVVAIMAAVLLFPAGTNDLMLAAVPKEARPPASRLIFVPALTIFVFGHFMFGAMPSLNRGSSVSPLQFYLALAGGLFFFIFGVFVCLRPLSFMRISVPKLRSIGRSSTDEKSMTLLSQVARVFGIIFLLGAGFFYVDGFR
jgi:hypothetical protein